MSSFHGRLVLFYVLSPCVSPDLVSGSQKFFRHDGLTPFTRKFTTNEVCVPFLYRGEPNDLYLGPHPLLILTLTMCRLCSRKQFSTD